MLIRKAEDIRSSEITPKSLYLNRRKFLAEAALAGAAATVGAGLREIIAQSATAFAGTKIDGIKKSPLSTTETVTPYKDVTNYNNYYECSTEKDEPAKLAKNFRTRPWKVKIDGLVGKKQELDVDAIIRMASPEERIYRHRCVEGWSMVIPWVGFPLADLVRRVEPTSRAKYVAFQTLLDPAQLPGERRRVLEWPYVEGLRIDEATHSLALLAVGVYGRVLPGQNGAPIRLVVPWKYGFKGAKSIVRIRFQEAQPRTTWNVEAPQEYGFYANVNPSVDHPRWSQASERRIGEVLRRKTLPFNGCGDEGAGL